MTHAPAPNSCSSSPSGRDADRLLDCLVVGAGPAGLTAATYLARFHRDFIVVDAGKSRARWIPTSHNCPGFPFGVAGPELLAKLRTQATEYGSVIVQIHPREAAEVDLVHLEEYDRRKYGSTLLIFFASPEALADEAKEEDDFEEDDFGEDDSDEDE